MKIRNVIIHFALIVFPISYSFGQTDSALQKLNFHFQTTYIYQYKPAFHSPYSGTNSLQGTEEKQNSVTATLYVGARLWKGSELYINPEIAGGSGLSGAYGLAASTNAETFRVGNPAPVLYLARAYLMQTFALGKGKEKSDDQTNGLKGYQPKNYLRLFIGKCSLGDLYDNNSYSNSPRIQFMNWCLVNNGTWDYASNVRGYTNSLTAILHLNDITCKAGFAAMATIANGPDLSTDFNKFGSINLEIDRSYKIGNKSGNIGFLGYDNYADMGNYQQAIINASKSDSSKIPDIISTREYGRHKFGTGINIGQQITETIGVFGRAGWSDGNNETWCYTEADHTASIGISFNGKQWKRENDNAGMGVIVNGLSQYHKLYLEEGGLGFELGDGKLNYGNEYATELYYSCKPNVSGIFLTGDYQFIINPGFNKDRGPVNVFSFRLHIEL